MEAKAEGGGMRAEKEDFVHGLWVFLEWDKLRGI